MDILTRRRRRFDRVHMQQRFKAPAGARSTRIVTSELPNELELIANALGASLDP
jgi:hypothetical protein